MTTEKHTPRYRWSSPQDWLGDKINDLIQKAQGGRLSREQDIAIAELAIIANAIVNGTLNVDSDSVQDAFQDEMDEAGYFRDLDFKVPVFYYMEPIGANGALEATGVHWFCSDNCRSEFLTSAGQEVDPTSVTAGESSDFEADTVCDECGKEVQTGPEKETATRE